MIVVYWYLIGLFAVLVLFGVTTWEANDRNEFYDLRYRNVAGYLVLAILGPIAALCVFVITVIILWNNPAVQRFLNRKVF